MGKKNVPEIDTTQAKNCQGISNTCTNYTKNNTLLE